MSKWDFNNNLLCNFIEIKVRHGYSPVIYSIFYETSFYKKTYGGLLILDLSNILVLVRFVTVKTVLELMSSITRNAAYFKNRIWRNNKYLPGDACINNSK